MADGVAIYIINKCVCSYYATNDYLVMNVVTKSTPLAIIIKFNQHAQSKLNTFPSNNYIANVSMYALLLKVD